MQRVLLWVFWAGATGYGLWRGVRLTFLPVGMQVTTAAVPPSAPPAPEVVTPTYLPGGFIILISLILLYGALAYLLFQAEYTPFRWLAGVHIVLSVLGFSLGWLFLPSSVLLLLAILVSFGLSQPLPQA